MERLRALCDSSDRFDRLYGADGATVAGSTHYESAAPMIEVPQEFNRWGMRIVSGLAIATLLVACVLVVARFWPIGPDYYFTFHRTAEKWLNGETRLYYDNQTTEVHVNHDIGFFNAPWTLVILVSLAFLQLVVLQAILT